MVVGTAHYARLFSTAKPGSGMRRIYESGLYVEYENIGEALKDAENTPKTLLYYGVNPRIRGIGNLTENLRLDSYFRVLGGFGFQKDSEFLQGAIQYPNIPNRFSYIQLKCHYKHPCL